jgi:hypothetical protein
MTGVRITQSKDPIGTLPGTFRSACRSASRLSRSMLTTWGAHPAPETTGVARVLALEDAPADPLGVLAKEPLDVVALDTF